MRYKVGDLVKIKTWKEMEKKYGLNEFGNIKNKAPAFVEEMEEGLSPNRIVKIYEVRERYNCYHVDGSIWNWTDNMIEGSLKELEPIKNRFEILDL